MFLKLSSLIEGQLRDAYAKKYDAGILNQSSLADKLGINRSAVHHRLTGRKNMTIETIADMVWGLEQDIELKIFDPSESPKNHRVVQRAVPHLRATEPTIDNNPLMRIASTAPSSNATVSPVLGGMGRPSPQETPLSYREQLVGTNR